jgi:hypothetical protein
MILQIYYGFFPRKLRLLVLNFTDNYCFCFDALNRIPDYVNRFTFASAAERFRRLHPAPGDDVGPRPQRDPDHRVPTALARRPPGVTLKVFCR